MAHNFELPEVKNRGDWPLLHSSMWKWEAWLFHGYHIQRRKNSPSMVDSGWRWEVLWACSMQMTTSSDRGTWSGSKGGSKSLSEYSKVSTWCLTSQNPIPWPDIWERFTQGCHRRTSVRGSKGRGSLAGSAYYVASRVRTVGWSWWPCPWRPISDYCVEWSRRIDSPTFRRNTSWLCMRSDSWPV